MQPEEPVLQWCMRHKRSEVAPACEPYMEEVLGEMIEEERKPRAEEDNHLS